MNIGFDLDKIFIDYPPFVPAWIFDKFYKEKDNGVLIYRIPGTFEQKLRMLVHAPFLRPAIKTNMQFLKQLAKDKKNHLYLVSSRFGFLKKRTDYLINQYQLDKLFKQLYFNYKNEQPHLFKDVAVKQAKIERYIDDDLSLLKYLAKNNPKVKFYWLNKKENKELMNNLFAITRIQDMLS